MSSALPSALSSATMSMKIGPDRSGNAIPVMTNSSKLLAGKRRHRVRVSERVR